MGRWVLGAQGLWQSVLGVKVEVLPGRVLFTSIAHLSQPGPRQGSQDGSFSCGGGEGKPEARVLVPGRPWATSVLRFAHDQCAWLPGKGQVQALRQCGLRSWGRGWGREEGPAEQCVRTLGRGCAGGHGSCRSDSLGRGQVGAPGSPGL